MKKHFQLTAQFIVLLTKTWLLLFYCKETEMNVDNILQLDLFVIISVDLYLIFKHLISFLLFI